MNEALENLRLRAGQLSLAEHKNWDEIIAVWTELIEREKEPNMKAVAYLHRGAAYNNRGDYDLAIADINETLKLASSDPLMKIMGLFYRGCAHDDKGDEDKAIKDFTEALGPGLPHKYMIDLKAQIHFRRGLAYQSKDDSIQAFKDFVEADNCDPVLKTKIPPIYIAVQIADSYKDSSEEDGSRIFVLYLDLLFATIEIQRKLFYPPGEGKEIAHYTSVHTLRKLASAGRFLLYNAAYMNDPEEGIEFFEVMKKFGIEDVEKVFYKDKDKSYPSPAYIGSFVKVDKEDEGKDKLFLWRTYGKHDGQEAAGACLIFKHEGTVFAENYRQQIGAMQQLQLQLKLLTSAGDISNPRERQSPKPALYEIVYSDEELNQRFSLSHARQAANMVSSDEWNKHELCEELKKLAESLERIKSHLSEKDEDIKDKLKQLVRDLLDTIRFLFKARHYREEKEVRVVQVRYDEEDTMQDEDGIQVDTEQIPPRFYLETHENFRFSEVILGPQARGKAEWKRWLKKRDEKLMVYKSEIPYGKPYL